MPPKNSQRVVIAALLLKNYPLIRVLRELQCDSESVLLRVDGWIDGIVDKDVEVVVLYVGGI